MIRLTGTVINKVNRFSSVITRAKNANLQIFLIRTIDFSNPEEKKMHDDLVTMVDKMLKLQKKIHSARLEQDKKLYKTQLDLIDKQIDSLVCKLYGLTEEEIKVMEGSMV